MTDPIRDAQKKGLISIELNDAQAELDRLSALMIKQIKLAYLIYAMLLPRHIVPVFDGQYVQHQDRPAIGFPRDRYLVENKRIELN